VRTPYGIWTRATTL